MFKVSVLIPAFNEEIIVGKTVSTIFDVLETAKIHGEIIVIDDGSSDSTASLAEDAGAVVLRHGSNRGYGAALKTGLKKASGDVIVITDADGTYPVDKIPELLSRFEETGAEMVVGSRTGDDVSIPLLRRPFKWILRCLAGYITGRSIPDLNSGLRVFRRKMALRYCHLYPNGFSFTSTITVASMCDNLDVEYFPIDYYQRQGRSKITPVDFFAFLMLVFNLSVLFKPLKVFLPVSTVCFLTGLLKLLYDVVAGLRMASTTGVCFFDLPVVSPTAISLMLAGLQIILVGMVAEALAKHRKTHEFTSGTEC